MAFQTIGGVYFPPVPNLAVFVGGTALTSFPMNAAGMKVACVFRAPATGVLDRFEYATGTVTTSEPLKLSWQGVSLTTGDPDGVISHYRVKTMTGGDDNIWINCSAITTDGTDGGGRKSVTKGDLIAAVIEFNAFSAANLNISMLRFASTAEGLYQNYTVTNNGVSWTKGTTTGMGFLVVYDGNFCYPIPSTTLSGGIVYSQTINNGTSPDEAGTLLDVPFTCKIDALFAVGDFDGDCDLVLYSGTTQLASAFMDATVRMGGNAGTSILPLATEITLVPGPYRVVVRPTTTTGCFVSYIAMPSNYSKNQYNNGNLLQWTQRTDAGAWTETVTRLTWCGFRISALSDVETGGGGGTGISRSRAQGGM